MHAVLITCRQVWVIAVHSSARAALWTVVDACPPRRWTRPVRARRSLAAAAADVPTWTDAVHGQPDMGRMGLVTPSHGSRYFAT